jgi:hypothetical protein
LYKSILFVSTLWNFHLTQWRASTGCFYSQAHVITSHHKCQGHFMWWVVKCGFSLCIVMKHLPWNQGSPAEQFSTGFVGRCTWFSCITDFFMRTCWFHTAVPPSLLFFKWVTITKLMCITCSFINLWRTAVQVNRQEIKERILVKIWYCLNSLLLN